MIMFSLSTALHTFQTVGENWNPVLARLDYIGISCMIVGSFLPVLYYIFFCEQRYATEACFLYAAAHLAHLCAPQPSFPP